MPVLAVPLYLTFRYSFLYFRVPQVFSSAQKPALRAFRGLVIRESTVFRQFPIMKLPDLLSVEPRPATHATSGVKSSVRDTSCRLTVVLNIFWRPNSA